MDQFTTFLKAGSVEEAKNVYNETVHTLEWACSTNNVLAVSYLLDKGIKVTQDAINASIVNENSLEILHYLYDATDKFKYSPTAVDQASSMGLVENLSFLKNVCVGVCVRKK